MPQPVGRFGNQKSTVAHSEHTQKPGARARILLVDSQVVVRQGISLLINQELDLAVCGGVSLIPAALDAIAKLQPDLVLADITVKSGNGLEMIKFIAAQHKDVPVLVLSGQEEGLYAETALRCGAGGYIMKDEPIERLLVAIRRVLSGKIYLSDNVSLQMIRQQVRGPRKVRSSPEELLSDRELQVFQLIGQWCQTGEIARELRLSVKTVQYYREKIKEKLNLQQASELTRFATERAASRQAAATVPS